MFLRCAVDLWPVMNVPHFTIWSQTKKLKWSRYRHGLVQRVGRGIALLFHDCGTRRRWVNSSTPRPHFTPGKDSVPILQEAGWAPGPVWTGRKSHPHQDSIPDCPARSQSLYRLSYPTHNLRPKLGENIVSEMTFCLYGRISWYSDRRQYFYSVELEKEEAEWRCWGLMQAECEDVTNGSFLSR